MNALDLSLTKKFINLLMINGKKNLAYKIFCVARYEFLRSSLRSLKTDKFSGGIPNQLRVAVENCRPSLECRKCKVGGTSRLVPAIVPQNRGESLAVRWIVQSARNRSRKSALPLSQCLAQELLDAYSKSGWPRQRRDQYHKLSEVNRGTLRYRWW